MVTGLRLGVGAVRRRWQAETAKHAGGNAGLELGCLTPQAKAPESGGRVAVKVAPLWLLPPHLFGENMPPPELNNAFPLHVRRQRFRWWRLRWDWGVWWWDEYDQEWYWIWDP